MTLEETTQLYASVLRQLLPIGGYDTSPNTEALAVDVYAHAKLLAQADLDGKRLLGVLEAITPELMNEYETEYGLPLKCTVNATRTFEERLEILNWVRTSRNVLNRAYLEQLLAIFGVVLIDIVKFKPLLCTAACDSPVNTEQLRYKVFLRLQYPMNADMSCIVENYLPGYLRIEWMIDMPWGDWILNSAVTVNTNGIAHYTAYKTNQREYYDSYANLDLTTAIVRSLHDADMQQWQAVKDAANQLTGVSSWSFDLPGKQLVYKQPADPYVSAEYSYRCLVGSSTFLADSLMTCAQSYAEYNNLTFVGCPPFTPTSPYQYPSCNFRYPNGNYTGFVVADTFWNPREIAEAPDEYLSFQIVAQKIISNASSSNQAISLLAETYLETVANSISNADPAKQFAKLSDLLSQFETNKTLRT